MAEREKRGATGLPNELHGEQTSLEALRAHQLGDDPGHETPGRTAAASEGVLTQVCMKCGNEVFRSFFSVVGDDEAATDFSDATERDLATNDDAGDVTRGDILDLNNI